MNDKKTHELDDIINFIQDENDLKEYINTTISSSVNVDFVDYLNKLLSEKNLAKAAVIKDSCIDRNYGYQIISGKKYASRDKVLRLCIAAKFTLEETNRLLSLGSYPRLYSKDGRDSIIIFSINKGQSTMDTDLLLDKLNKEPLE